MTASPARLLLMTYDGGTRFIRLAGRAMDEKNLEEQHVNITKAQRIVLELINTLDHSTDPKLADSLNRLYRYIHDRLTYANVYDDKAALTEAEKLMAQLRESWAQAEESFAPQYVMVGA